jgi:poly-D-alanine transfer protein DltD
MEQISHTFKQHLIILDTAGDLELTIGHVYVLSTNDTILLLRPSNFSWTDHSRMPKKTKKNTYHPQQKETSETPPNKI